MSPGGRLALVSALLAALLAGLAVWFARDSYEGNRSRAEAGLRDVAAQAASDTRSFTASRFDLLGMLARQVEPGTGPRAVFHRRLRELQDDFSGGIGLADERGRLTLAPGRRTRLGPEAAALVERVLSTGRPAQSGMIVSPAFGGVTAVYAVPTAGGRRQRHVVLGAVTFRWLQPATAAYRLPPGAVLWIAAGGRLIAGPGLAAPRDARGTPLLRAAAGKASGVRRGVTGLDGKPSRVVAWSREPRSGWLLLVEQSERELFSSFRSTLQKQLAAIAVLLVLGAVGIGVLARRFDRLSDAQRAARETAERRLQFARSLGMLSAELAGAGSAAEVRRIVLGWMTAFGARDVALAVRDNGGAVLYRQAAEAMEVHATPIPSLPALAEPQWPESWDDDGRDPLGEASWLDAPVAALALPLTFRDESLGVAVAAFDSPTELDDDAKDCWRAFAAQASHALERARLNDLERSIAAEFQHQLLPGAIAPPRGTELSAVYRPAESDIAVGGDWYDAIDLGGDRVALIVGDVIGHGVRAAVVMGQLRTAIATLAPNCRGPAELLERLDECIQQIEGGEFSTVQCAYVDLTTGFLRCASAGHPPLLALDAAGRAEFVWDGRSEPLGAGTGRARAEAVRRLEPGGALVLYTDGLYERPRGDIAADLERVRRASEAAARADGSTAAAIVDLMLSGDPQRDDVAVLTLELRARTVPSFVLPVSGNLGSLRRELTTWLARHVSDAGRVRDIVLATHEAAVNATEHARAGAGPDVWAFVEAAIVEDRLDVVVRDNGRWREPSPVLDPSDEAERGRGLLLVHHLADAATIDRTRGTAVTMSFDLRGRRRAEEPHAVAAIEEGRAPAGS